MFPTRLVFTRLAWTVGLILSSQQALAAANSPPTNPAFEQTLRRSRQELWAGQLQSALIDAKLAVGMEPGNAYAHAQLGIALDAVEDYAYAKAELELARRLGASEDVTLNPLFKATLALGGNQSLLALYADPADQDSSPHAATVLRARALALQNLGNDADALAAINRSLAIRRDVDSLVAAAQIALVQGNPALAKALSDEALRLAPKSRDAVLCRIHIALKSGDGPKALALAERQVAEMPNDLGARLERLTVYLALNQIDKAKPEVDRLPYVASSNVANYFRALVLARTNDATAAWAIAQSLPSEFLESRAEIAVNVANMAAQAGFLESGAGILSAALARNQSLLDARLLLADIRLRQNGPQSALSILAPASDSKDPRVAVMFARAYSLSGRHDLANNAISRAIALGAGEELLPLGKDVALRALHDWLQSHPGDQRARGHYAMLTSKSSGADPRVP